MGGFAGYGEKRMKMIERRPELGGGHWAIIEWMDCE